MSLSLGSEYLANCYRITDQLIPFKKELIALHIKICDTESKFSQLLKISKAYAAVLYIL